MSYTLDVLTDKEVVGVSPQKQLADIWISNNISVFMAVRLSPDVSWRSHNAPQNTHKHNNLLQSKATAEEVQCEKVESSSSFPLTPLRVARVFIC